LGQLLGGGDDDPDGLGVVELVVDLPGRQRGVGRDGDGAGGEDGHVGDQPVGAVLGHQPDGVAGPDADVGQGAGPGQGRGAVVVPGPVDEQPAPPEAPGV